MDGLKPSIHPSYAKLLCAHLKAQGVDMETLFHGNSISWKDLLSKQDFINFAQYRWLVIKAIEMTGKPWLGLEVSSIIQVSAHGPLGYGAVAASTVGEAMLLVDKAIATRLQIVELDLFEEGEMAHIDVIELIPLEEITEFVYVALLGSMLDLIEKTSGSTDIDMTAHFPFEEPPWLNEYIKRFEGISLAFGAEQFHVSFSKSILAQPCMTADEYVYRNAMRECEQLLESGYHLGSLVSMVRQYLYDLRDDFPSENQAAEHFNMSVRSFIRKLKAENSSFQTLLDEVRKDLACWHLQNTADSIENIATQLGYVDTSNFSRVFKRWMDMKPSHFRKLSQDFKN